MFPTSLDKTNFIHTCSKKVWDRAPQKVGRRHKVSVKDGNILATRMGQCKIQRTRLVTSAIRPPDHQNIAPVAAIPRQGFFSQRSRLVVRVVQNLYLEQMLRIILVNTGINEPFDHMVFIKSAVGLSRQATVCRQSLTRQISERHAPEFALGVCGYCADKGSQPRRLCAINSQIKRAERVDNLKYKLKIVPKLLHHRSVTSQTL